MKRATKGKGQENVGSSLLSPQENERLEHLLGRRCVSLSSAVVQLLMALPSEPNRWTPQQSGVVCFVKDSPQRSFFIRLYDVKAGNLVWEQEIYNQLMYRRTKPFFHTFPGDDCQVGLNFADVAEADSFFAVVEEKISQRNNRFGSGTPTSSAMPPLVLSNSQNQITPSKSKKDKKEKDKKSKKKGSKLLKGDIGTPSGFTHVSHLGMGPNNLDPELMKVLSCAGISEADMNDSETSQLIYDVIERSGGIEAVKKASTRPPVPSGHRGSLPQVPSGFSSAPPPIPQGRMGPLPPVPGQDNSGYLPPPPQSDTPLPPPPSDFFPPPACQSFPPPPPEGFVNSVPPPHPFESNFPPRSKSSGFAPPLPPVSAKPSAGSPPPPPPPPPPAAPPPMNFGSNPSPPNGPPPPASSSGEGGRGALLTQIQSGMKLKKVTTNPDPPPALDTGEGIVGALMMVMQKRSKVIHSSEEDDEFDDDEDDDEEWD
uniref:Wiskott-Aldrich syndrome protein-like n=1 Tax=Sinocyclocheilus rhinocerous TaxID=307959 RepID=A0A673HMK1_9TELE